MWITLEVPLQKCKFTALRLVLTKALGGDRFCAKGMKMEMFHFARFN